MFRGPNASGVAEATGLPVEFSPEKNLVWKTPLPPGHSSPVFGNDAIFLTGWEGDSLFTFAINRDDGKILWRREIKRGRQGELHDNNSPASPSPVTDGRNVYVMFQDIGLLSYGPDGNERWAYPAGAVQQPDGDGHVADPSRGQDHSGVRFRIRLVHLRGRQGERKDRVAQGASAGRSRVFDAASLHA